MCQTATFIVGLAALQAFGVYDTHRSSPYAAARTTPLSRRGISLYTLACWHAGVFPVILAQDENTCG